MLAQLSFEQTWVARDVLILPAKYLLNNFICSSEDLLAKTELSLANILVIQVEPFEATYKFWDALR